MALYRRGMNTAESVHRPMRRPEGIAKVLSLALKRHGLDKEIARYNFVLHWSEIVGEKIATLSRPECIRNGTLVVRVKNSSWAQELSFQKDIILARLQRFLKEGDLVSDVTFYVGDLS